VEGSIFSGSLSSLHVVSFSPLFYVLSFYKVWQGFIKKVKMLRQGEDDLNQTFNQLNL
jgi:hypothetical protein